MRNNLIYKSVFYGLTIPILSSVVSFVIGVYIINIMPGNIYYGAIHMYFIISVLTILISQYYISRVTMRYNRQHFSFFVTALTIIYFLASYFVVKLYLDVIMQFLPVGFGLLVAYSYPFTNHAIKAMILMLITIVTYIILRRETRNKQ